LPIAVRASLDLRAEIGLALASAVGAGLRITYETTWIEVLACQRPSRLPVSGNPMNLAKLVP
jgi:hypothetical protein